jgi:hypothetical protein
MHYTLNEDKKCCCRIKLGAFFKFLPVFYFYYQFDIFLYLETLILLCLVIGMDVFYSLILILLLRCYINDKEDFLFKGKWDAMIKSIYGKK